MKPTSTPVPGDLVMQNGGAHVGIYVGNGMMISALNPSQGTILHAVSATGTSAFYTLR
jgi:cell wall-associated NlpC family hydrolase